MHSKESDHQQAILKLEHDLLNGPYHCFGYHAKCSTDFCRSAQQSATSAMQSIPPDNYVSDIPNYLHDSSSSTFVDNSTTSNTQHDDPEEAIIELQEEWQDATNDTNLQAIPTASTASPSPQKGAIICDI